MAGFDFFITASAFSLLGYGLCYITFAGRKDSSIDKKKEEF